MWSNPKSKGGPAPGGLMGAGGAFGQCQSRLLDTPLTPAPHRMQDGEAGTSSMMASPAHGWRGGEGMGLALTAVDDLTGWLQHNKLVACPGAAPPGANLCLRACGCWARCAACLLVRGAVLSVCLTRCLLVCARALRFKTSERGQEGESKTGAHDRHLRRCAREGATAAAGRSSSPSPPTPSTWSCRPRASWASASRLRSPSPSV